MTRATFVFGNGLGRALDNYYFQLSSGLKHVWQSSENFSNEQKRLVISALPGTDQQKFPRGEEELDRLQVALLSATLLQSLETDEVRWLNDDSRELPRAFRRYVHEVASYFGQSGLSLPPDFVNSLTSMIRDSGSHVAVLNYDNLLYDAFTREGILRGYNDTLNDGFLRTGFHPENLARHLPRAQAWYMHLHGSPLFIGNKKLMREERQELSPSENSHIVLTALRHKSLLISNSPILSEYWEHFRTALSESSKAILVGYSGLDEHLNTLINERLEQRRIFIVERNNHETSVSRYRFWRRRFPGFSVAIFRPKSILEFLTWRQFLD